MNPLYKEREMAYQLEKSEASAILIRPEMLPLLQKVLSEEPMPNLKHVIVLGEQVPEDMPDALPFATFLKGASPTTSTLASSSSVRCCTQRPPARF